MVIIVIQLQADLSDVLHESHLLSIEVKQKFDEDLHRKVVLVLRQSHERQDERMLLADLIDQDVLASVLPEFVVDNRAWDQHEQEHVEEDEDDVEYVVGLRVLEGWGLIIRIVVISPQDVDLHDHLAEIVKVALVDIVPSWVVGEIGVDVRRVIADDNRS